MSTVPTELEPQLKAWWASLDGGVQAILDYVYMEAPGAVSRAVSGGVWNAVDPEPGLAAQLGGDAPGLQDGDPVPQLRVEEIVVKPSPDPSSRSQVVSWTERNGSTTAFGYVTDLYIYGPDDELVDSARFSQVLLEPRKEVTRSHVVEAQKVGGRYVAKVWTNAEGSDPGQGGPAGTQGYRIAYGTTFVAGAGVDADRERNLETWARAREGLDPLAGHGTLHPEDWGRVLEGLKHMAAVTSFDQATLTRIQDVTRRAEGLEPADLSTDEGERHRAMVQRTLEVAAHDDPKSVDDLLTSLEETVRR